MIDKQKKIVQNGNQSLSLWINSSKESILTSLNGLGFSMAENTFRNIYRSENRNSKNNEIGMGHKNCSSDSTNTQVILLL